MAHWPLQPSLPQRWAVQLGVQETQAPAEHSYEQTVEVGVYPQAPLVHVPAVAKVVRVSPVQVAAGGVSHAPHDPPQPSLPHTAVPQLGVQFSQAPFAQPWAQVALVEV